MSWLNAEPNVITSFRFVLDWVLLHTKWNHFFLPYGAPKKSENNQFDLCKGRLYIFVLLYFQWCRFNRFSITALGSYFFDRSFFIRWSFTFYTHCNFMFRSNELHIFRCNEFFLWMTHSISIAIAKHGRLLPKNTTKSQMLQSK